MFNTYGRYDNMLFNEVFNDSEDFVSAYKGTPLYDEKNGITDHSAEVLYYLLLAKYGNDVIAPNSVERFKLMMFSIIYQYGASWEKHLDMQAKLRSLSDDELMKGTKQIHNQAANPSVAPGTFSDDELTFINAQNTSNIKRGKLEAYTMLEGVLRTDYTEELLGRFKPLFLTIVAPQHPYLYRNEEYSND